MEQIEQKTIIRVCKQCNEVKNIDMFPKSRNKKNTSFRHRCIECEKILKIQQNRKYYEKVKARTNKTE
jgi:hypothetical protein